MRVAILFDNFGPYHLARLRATSSMLDLLAIEFGRSSAEYAWSASADAGIPRVVLNKEGDSSGISRKIFKQRLENALESFRPDAVFVPGWSCRGALLALSWCLKRKLPAIVMSESTAWDETRHPIKEWIKSAIVSLFSAALVGGSPHRAYMEQLGMPSERIFLGYDVVDNYFFDKRVNEIRGSEIGFQNSSLGESSNTKSYNGSQVLDSPSTPPYFLASARFIEKKNLPMLLKAYALYRQKAIEASDAKKTGQEGDNDQQSYFRDSLSLPWDLVLLGDGDLRPSLEKLCVDLGISAYVHMVGFKQYDELPFFYAGAGAFIHTSTTEQWGLVVNEAMASGLPVLISNRCGCAVDLVDEGINGWTFDSTDAHQLSDLLGKIQRDPSLRDSMGLKSREIISRWSPDLFAKGVVESSNAAVCKLRSHMNYLCLAILWLISRR